MLWEQVLEGRKKKKLEMTIDANDWWLWCWWCCQPVLPQLRNGMFHCHCFPFHHQDKCMLCQSCQLQYHHYWLIIITIITTAPIVVVIITTTITIIIIIIIIIINNSSNNNNWQLTWNPSPCYQCRRCFCCYSNHPVHTRSGCQILNLPLQIDIN